jgi:hypothetical protein
MKFLFSFFFLIIVSAIAVQQETNPISRKDLELEISQSAPSEDSPFLIEREDAQQALAKAAASGLNNPFPVRHPLQKQIGNFFTHLFHSFKPGDQNSIAGTQIFVEPATFSVTDTPELDITLKIINTKKELIMLEFPTNQRIEITVKNSLGKVVTHWSEDRSFDEMPGLVTINPKESIAYTEKISTSMMRDGETYIIEASIVNQSGYSSACSIIPTADVLGDESYLNN